jgi:HCOMODA/2-hydroxy-3-carboxy-muconic semialdehyde decarboxylase
MRAHGSVACGPTLESAVFRAVYTEVSARVQHWAMALAEDGEELAVLSDEEGALADVPNQTAGLRAWDLWREEIRKDTGW